MRLWPQTEALKAHAVMARRHRDSLAGAPGSHIPSSCALDAEASDALALVVATVRNIGACFLADCPQGTWTDQLDAFGAPVSQAIPASSFYHVFMGYAELDPSGRCGAGRRRGAAVRTAEVLDAPARAALLRCLDDGARLAGPVGRGGPSPGRRTPGRVPGHLRRGLPADGVLARRIDGPVGPRGAHGPMAQRPAAGSQSRGPATRHAIGPNERRSHRAAALDGRGRGPAAVAVRRRQLREWG